jgi:hypothetical protein
MPGPTEPVILDPVLVRTLIQRLRDLRDLLGRWARAVVALLGPLGWPADPVTGLRVGVSWADTSASMLTRRLALAEAADIALRPGSGPRPALAVGPSAASGATGGTGRLTLRSRPDPFDGDALAARTAGARLGRALAGAALAPAADLTTLDDAVAELRASARDPDVVAGFVDALGPARLAAVLRLAEHVDTGGFAVVQTADGYQVGPVPGGDRSRAGGPSRWLPTGTADGLTAALGTALATFSQSGRLSASWLSRFNARGVTGPAETVLLGPLLGHGRFAPATLRLLGDALVATTDVSADRYRTRTAPITDDASPTGGPRTGGPRTGGPPAAADVGLWGADPGGRHRAAYAAALLRAIADEPTLAARFATDHVAAIVAGSRLSALPAAIGAGVPADIARAWAYLVDRAGGAETRQADPAGAATFVARLGFDLYQYRAAHADPGRRADTSWPLPTAMRAAIGNLLHVWRAELYGSAVGLLPAADALRNSSGRGLATAWPVPTAVTGAAGGGPWSTHLAGPVDATRIPAEVWAALLGEALAAGGPVAEALGSDVLRAAAGLEQSGWAATKGYRGDGHVAYPASPRALVHLQQAGMVSFFLTALAGTAAELTLRVELSAEDEARRTDRVLDQLAAVAKSIKFDDLVGTLYGLTVGVTVAGAVDAARPDGRPAASALATIADVAAASSAQPDWQDAYRASATAVWLRRADDPILPVEVTDAAGVRRTFTGDPRADEFITGPGDDFLDADDRPRPPDRMSPTQRSAYLRWLASPAIVANNDNLPTLRETMSR